MLVLGFSGGYDLINENRHLNPEHLHDAAAVLVEDGNVLFAVEEERLNRIKHTNKFPTQAIQACLESRNVQLKDIDIISYYLEELDFSFDIDYENLKIPRSTSLVSFFQELFRRGLDEKLDADKFRFVNHHYAHAMSSFALSGFETSLVITLDGEGDGCSGVVLKIDGNHRDSLHNFDQSKPLEIISTNNSLGYFYISVIKYLGYKCFDEYKVMGLAPYGDPKKLRKVFSSFYTLLAEGKFEINYDNIIRWTDTFKSRRKGEPFTQEHQDIAAALQESLENIVLHTLKHYQTVSQQDNLCLAGGVAHNCTLNGRILRSGIFKNVFIQPASHDAGCALGAALVSCYQLMPGVKPPSRLKHVYLGKDIAKDDEIRHHLARWQSFLAFNRPENIIESTADLLANDLVGGWVQGRSEFGPRALGNRSILADARPNHNKDRINQLVKKRESYRPFAPSVIEEEVNNYFEVESDRAPHEFMIMVVKVRKEKRKLLGAVTHIDGTSRIQLVSRQTNDRFWNLIRTFGEKTGVPVLLNTSFNNHVEPIVDSVDDAIASFLTTELDFLVIGDYLIERKDITWQLYLILNITIPPHVLLHQIKAVNNDGRLENFFFINVNYDNKIQHKISEEMFKCLSFANSKLSIGEILLRMECKDMFQKESIVNNLIDLWSTRLIILSPAK